MALHANVQQSPGSHFAVVDSGTSVHTLQYRLFTSTLSEDYTTISGFSGNTSRVTHRGDFNCVVWAQNGRLIHLVDPTAALVIPDSHRNLYSVRHAQLAGHTVILGAQAGLLPYVAIRTLRPVPRRQINRPLASTLATPTTGTQRCTSNLQCCAIIRTRSKIWLQRFGSRYRAQQHRPTIFYGIWQWFANDNSTYINISHFQSRSNKSSKQPPPSRAYHDKSSSIVQHRQNFATSIENANSQESLYRRIP